MLEEAPDTEVLTESPDLLMRIRVLFNRWHIRISNFFGLSSHYRYSLVDGTGDIKSRRNAQWKAAAWTELPFFLGVPLSLSLIYINPTLALCISFPLLFLLVIFLFHKFENFLLYARNEPNHSRMLYEHPQAHGFDTWEFIHLRPDGKRGPILSGLLLLLSDPVARAASPTILVLHGNAGNAGHRLPFCRLLVDSVHCNILIIDYRGYGRSTGMPTEPGLYADARSALEFLHNRSDLAADKLYVFGRSLGGAVSIQLVISNPDLPVRGVIVENTFTSLPAAAHHIFSSSFGSVFRYLLPSYFFLNRYPSLKRLRVHGRSSSLPPFLFLSGGADEVIPPKMMRELYQAYRDAHADSPALNASDPSSFLATTGQHGLVCFPEGKHNCTWLCPQWPEVVSHFIRNSLNSAPQTHQTADV